MTGQHVDKKTEASLTGVKIALVGTIVAAIIGATATITAALLQSRDPAPPTSIFDQPGYSPRKVFDEDALESDDGVEKILVGSYGLLADQIQNVDCPAGQEVKAGTKFTCTVQFDGDNPWEKEVEITVRDDSGEYEVGIPQDR